MQHSSFKATGTYDKSLQEMLRRTRERNTTKDKAMQHNLPEAVFFKEILAALGGIQTHNTLMPTLCKLPRQLSWPG